VSTSPYGAWWLSQACPDRARARWPWGLSLFAEGMQRFLEGLSTYSRLRLSQAQRPDADRIDHLPAALALRQRPPVPACAAPSAQ